MSTKGCNNSDVFCVTLMDNCQLVLLIVIVPSN